MSSGWSSFVNTPGMMASSEFICFTWFFTVAVIWAHMESQINRSAAVPQVFLTSLPPVAAQIPVSAVQLHPMVISQQSSSNLTELQVVSLDIHQSKED